MFIMLKQLNGPILKTFNPKRSGPKLEKVWPVLARVRILYFVSGRAELGPKINFFFGLGRARSLKNPALADLYFNFKLIWI